jgi:hypothetical protein
MTTNNAAKGNEKMNETANLRVSHCPSRYNILNQAHLSYAPVQCKTAILFVSGSREVTEFRVGDEGFRALTWVQSRDGSTAELINYDPASPTAAKLWKTLEMLCLSGHARLSDRASVRGVGSDPRSRSMNRATDDVSTVVNWVKRAERWYEKRTAAQRKSILRANAAIAAGTETVETESKIPYLPPAREVELAENARVNRVTGANILPQQIVVGGVKHWDFEGALAVRGRRTAGGVSQRAIIGKRELIQRLRDMAQRQLTRAAECADSDPEASEECLCYAQNSEARADRLQDELNARMAKAREARRVKRQAALKLRECAAEAVSDEAAHGAREAAARKEVRDDVEDM